jgi:hypothetical protein
MCPAVEARGEAVAEMLTKRLALLRHHNSQMTAFRDAVEGARRANSGKPIAVEYP